MPNMKAFVAMEESVEELERDITCGVCHSYYTEPKVLPCLHYFCKYCILVIASKEDVFSCPECNLNIPLPKEGVPSLKDAFFVEHLKELHSRFLRAYSGVKVACESCTGGEAMAFCQECTSFICRDCLESHLRMKAFAGHKPISLEEIRNSKGKDSVLRGKTKFQMCPQHNEQIKIYCFDCSTMVCRDCAIKDHNGHKQEFMEIASPKVREKLQKQLDPLKEVKKCLSSDVESVQAVERDIEAEVDVMSTQIQTLFNELHEILDNRKQELLVELKLRVTDKLARLSDQKKTLTSSGVAVRSVIDYTEQCINHCAIDELLYMQNEIEDRIESEVEKQKRDGFHPAESPNITLEANCTDDLKQLCHTMAKLLPPQLPAPKPVIPVSKGAVSVDGIKKVAEVNKMSEFIVTGNLGDDKPLQCLLTSRGGGTTTQCHINRIDNTYHVQYTPSLRGRHEIVVTAPGLEIPGSPFPVFVSIHPTDLVKPIRSIKEGLTESPNFVAVKSSGELVIVGNYNLTVFSAMGIKMTSLNMKEAHAILPYGLAVDNAGKIYISGHRQGGFIVKLTADLKLIKLSRKIDANFQNMLSVGNELMVCNDNDKNIMVFSRDLEHVRNLKIAPWWLKHLNAVTVDSDGNIYVCGAESPILVYSSGGQFLRSFAGKNLGVPYGICVSGSYVYVSDYASNDILAYTTEGEYITRHNFTRPFGVCADKDGFIYVCDHGIKRVAIL
jgi:DNA-binding beta-propeller fold protein YncE